MKGTVTSATLFCTLFAALPVSPFCLQSPHAWNLDRFGTRETVSHNLNPLAVNPSRQSVRISRTLGRVSSSPNNDDFDSDFPPPMDSNNGIDWDAEWKKVVANKDQPKKRPGQDFYKSEAEIVVTKTVNRSIESVQKKVKEAKMDQILPNAMNSVSSLTIDWRFWIAVMAVVSIATAVVTAPSQLPLEQTYYI